MVGRRQRGESRRRLGGGAAARPGGGWRGGSSRSRQPRQGAPPSPQVRLPRERLCRPRRPFELCAAAEAPLR